MKKVKESMNEVETFFEKDLADIAFEVEALDEWKELNEQLGLTNQSKLTTGKTSPVPYPYMNETMKRVYGTLCPQHSELVEYDKTPIPLEVLKQISFSTKEKHFTSIEIWYDDKTPDPLVVGRITKYYTYTLDENGKEGYNRVEYNTQAECLEVNPGREPSKTSGDYYIVARWGDVKRGFEELKEVAKERLIERHSADLEKEVRVMTAKLKNIKENATLYLLGELSLWDISK